MDQIKIGTFLKELRKEHELSQEQLAERFNVSSRSVSRWENGNTMPDISIMIELADFYDIDIRDLLRDQHHARRPSAQGQDEQGKEQETYSDLCYGMGRARCYHPVFPDIHPAEYTL